MKLYVGNLSYSTTEETLKTLFSNYADVASVEIMRDRFTQQSKGFGFVEIEDEIKAQRAIGGMNGKDVDGRRLRVSEAVEKPRRERRDFDDEEFRSRTRDYDRNYDRSRNGGRDSDYRDSRNSDNERSGYRRSGRRDFDSRDSDGGRSGYGRDDYRRNGGGRSNYGRFSRRNDNPDEY